MVNEWLDRVEESSSDAPARPAVAQLEALAGRRIGFAQSVGEGAGSPAPTIIGAALWEVRVCQTEERYLR
jgi:hypothetical protein